ncbi:MAG TPA: hypothetical protein VH988_30930 [Thermoanaerobaculia bacterium]|nr:hypothetical protein [Thermoanaerobaculia bacterium]
MPTLNLSSEFGRLIVLESLRPSDVKTGQRLLTHIHRWVVEGAALPPAGLKRVENATELGDAIDVLCRLSLREGRIPILHIEAHGGKPGLQCADGSYLHWPDLADLLRPINGECRNNLLLVLACCDGNYFALELLKAAVLDRCPVWALVACSGPAGPYDIDLGFYRFYEEFLASGDGNAALEALNAAASGSQQFMFIPAEKMFLDFFRYYLSAHGTRRVRQARVEECLSEIIEAGLPGSLQEHRDNLKFRISRPEVVFAEKRDHCLWLDLYPEERARFPSLFAHASERP